MVSYFVGKTYKNMEGASVMATKRSEQQMAADRKHAMKVSFKFNKVFDYEIVEWLQQQPNKQGAVKEAILFYLDNKDREEDD